MLRCVKCDRVQGVTTSVSHYKVVLVEPALSTNDSPDLSAKSNNDTNDGLPFLVTAEALSNKNPHIAACYNRA